MSAAPTFATAVAQSDVELVAAVRAGDDAAFAELYRRYYRRIAAFVFRLVSDPARAEDVTQEAFLSALRRLRVTDSEIAFKPWIYEIARNASIDLHRRTSRAEEVSMDQDGALRPSDRCRLIGAAAPDSAVFAKERMDHLCGAMDELSETHHRIIVMRELEGLSYREIGDRLELTRPAVESTLFRARRRLEREYEELEAGRRCETIRGVIARLAEGVGSQPDRLRLARHTRRCSACRRRARELGIEPLFNGRAAALLPFPLAARRRGPGALTGTGASVKGGGVFGSLLMPGAGFGHLVGERAAALIAAVAMAGAGGAALKATDAVHSDAASRDRPAAVRQDDRGGPARAAVVPRSGAVGAAAPSSRSAPPRHRRAAPRTGGRTAPGRRTSRHAPRLPGLALPDTPAVPRLPQVAKPRLPTLPRLPAEEAPALPKLGAADPDPSPPALPHAAVSPPPAVTLPAVRVSVPPLPVSLP